MKPDWLDR